MDVLQHWLPTAIAVVLLVAVATAGLVVAGITRPWSAVGAIGRAIVQLGTSKTMCVTSATIAPKIATMVTNSQ